jgi:hypothetical protein
LWLQVAVVVVAVVCSVQDNPIKVILELLALHRAALVKAKAAAMEPAQVVVVVAKTED